jgi:hypothetical protein
MAATMAIGLSLGGFGVAASTAPVDTAGVVEIAACTPGYSPCIKNKPSDVDCRRGSGNGPRYTKPGVVYRVTGSDRYRLDSDNDGKGCERR